MFTLFWWRFSLNCAVLLPSFSHPPSVKMDVVAKVKSSRVNTTAAINRISSEGFFTSLKSDLRGEPALYGGLIKSAAALTGN